MSVWRRVLRALLLPTGMLAAGEIVMRVQGYAGDALSKPTDVIVALYRALADGTFARATAQTLASSFAGLALGTSLGLAVGLWFGLSFVARSLSAPTVEALRTVPAVALIPLSMLAFGFGVRMESSVVAFACIWPMLILTQAAVRQVEPRLLEVARMLQLPRSGRISKIIMPAAAPRIFVAFRISVGVALVVGITVEIAANPYGLGYLAVTSQQNLRPDLMLATILWIGLLGWGLNAALHGAQRRAFPLAPDRVAVPQQGTR